MRRRPPRSTRTDHSFPTRRSSDLRKQVDVRGPILRNKGCALTTIWISNDDSFCGSIQICNTPIAVIPDVARITYYTFDVALKLLFCRDPREFFFFDDMLFECMPTGNFLSQQLIS